MTRISAIFGWPPSVNHAWRPTKNHGKILSDEYKAFIKHVAACVLEQRVPRHWTTARLLVALNCRAPNDRSFDIDNRVKTTLDAIARAGVIVNDKDIDALIVMRGEPDPPNGSIGVVIEELPSAEFATLPFVWAVQPLLRPSVRVPTVSHAPRVYKQSRLFKSKTWRGVSSGVLLRKY